MHGNAPKTFDEFVREYTPEIQGFIRFKNSKNSTKLDPDDFFQDVLIKFDKSKILDKYDPERGASFRTFFFRIINNFYNTVIRIQAEEDKSLCALPDSYDKIIDGRQADNNPDTFLKTSEIFVCIDNEDLKIVLDLIENIPDVKERLSIKLKSYPFIRLNDEEMNYMVKTSGIKKKQFVSELKRMFEAKAGERAGLKDKDAAKLIGYASFTNQRERAVRKHIISQYVYMKSRKE